MSRDFLALVFFPCTVPMQDAVAVLTRGGFSPKIHDGRRPLSPLLFSAIYPLHSQHSVYPIYLDNILRKPIFEMPSFLGVCWGWQENGRPVNLSGAVGWLGRNRVHGLLFSFILNHVRMTLNINL